MQIIGLHIYMKKEEEERILVDVDATLRARTATQSTDNIEI